MRAALVVFSLLIAPLTANATPCATTVEQLRTLFEDPLFPLSWEETSMEDGRPLVVSVSERPDGLFVSFTKSGVGVWAQGAATLCRSGSRMEARFRPGQLQTGEAAGWLLRRSLGLGAAIRLEKVSAQQLRIGAVGWSGTFVPGSPRVGLRAP